MLFLSSLHVALVLATAFARGAVLGGSAFGGLVGARIMRWKRAWIYAVGSALLGSLLLFKLNSGVVSEPTVSTLAVEGARLVSAGAALYFSIPTSTSTSETLLRLLISVALFTASFVLSLSMIYILYRVYEEEPLEHTVRVAPFRYAICLSIPITLCVLLFLRAHFPALPALHISIAAGLTLLIASSIIYPLAQYFVIPWLKRRAFSKYPQELLEFTTTLTRGERAASLISDGGTAVDSSSSSSSGEEEVIIRQQTGVVLPAAVLNRLATHSPARRSDVEAAVALTTPKRDQSRSPAVLPSPTTSPTTIDLQGSSGSREQSRDRPSLSKQTERALNALRAEELYSLGVLLQACFLLVAASQHCYLNEDSYVIVGLSVMAMLGGVALLGGPVSKHVGRSLLTITPSSALMSDHAIALVLVVCTWIGYEGDFVACRLGSMLGLAVHRHRFCSAHSEEASAKQPSQQLPSSSHKKQQQQRRHRAESVRWGKLGVFLAVFFGTLFGIVGFAHGIERVLGNQLAAATTTSDSSNIVPNSGTPM